MASRSANNFRAGEPVSRYEELKGANLILISVPDRLLEQTTQDLCESALSWRRRSVLLLGSALDSRILRPLEVLGACTGTLQALGPLEDLCFLVEGKPEAIRSARKLVPGGKGQLIEIAPGTKKLFLRGVARATQEFIPVLAAMIDDFRASGLQKTASEAVATRLVEAGMKAYWRAGHRALNRGSRTNPVDPWKPVPPLLQKNQFTGVAGTTT